MSVELAIAGLSCFVLALGHAAIGRRWVLPNLTKDRVPGTPFGSPSVTLGMVHFTWHVVTLMNLAFGTFLMTLAFAEDANPKTLVLRWFAALWFAAAAMAFWNVRRRPSSLLRFPVPFLFIVVAAMCLTASV